jgi:hypothetical protein
MNGNTWLLAALAFVIVALATPFQLLDVPLAPIAALVLGAVAGWWVANRRGEHTAGSGVQAGALVGLGALLGSIFGLAVLALWIGNIPEVQTFVQNSEPHPEARIPTEWVAPLGALAGVVVGFIVGLFDLLVAAVAGGVAGAIYHYNHPVKA